MGRPADARLLDGERLHGSEEQTPARQQESSPAPGSPTETRAARRQDLLCVTAPPLRRGPHPPTRPGRAALWELWSCAAAEASAAGRRGRRPREPGNYSCGGHSASPGVGLHGGQWGRTTRASKTGGGAVGGGAGRPALFTSVFTKSVSAKTLHSAQLPRFGSDFLKIELSPSHSSLVSHLQALKITSGLVGFWDKWAVFRILAPRVVCRKHKDLTHRQSALLSYCQRGCDTYTCVGGGPTHSPALDKIPK